VTGIDRDKGAVAMAQKRCRRGRFLVAEVPPVPLDNASFDTIVCFETVEHIQDDRGFLAELRRLIVPGGRLFISSPNVNVSAGGNPWHEREYTLPDLTAKLDDAGFAVDAVFAQRIPVTGSRRLASRVAWRLRLMRLAYGDLRIRPWDGQREPVYWVLACSLTTMPSVAVSRRAGGRGSQRAP
jgi:SAM-dependent methyltransferase